MKNGVITFLILGTFLQGSISHAFSHEDEVHLAAHAGTSFALQTFFYGLNSRVFKMSSPVSEVVAVVETLGIGLLYKVGENADTDTTRKSMLENTLGVGSAITTHIIFQF